MQLKNIFSNELIEQYKEGKREFVNINLQYADISMPLKDLVIRDSRLFFVTFRDCDLSNAKFINCEIFYGTWYGGILENAVFDDCAIDYGLFDKTIFRNTKIVKSKITWSGMLGQPINELDMSTSTQFKIITDMSQITPEAVEEIRRQIGPIINSLDLSIKAKINEEIQKDAQKYGVELPSIATEKPAYGARRENADSNSSVYGGNMQNFADMVIGAYNAVHPYKVKRSYQDDNNTGYK
ncbi:MAG: hypothetical protein NT120_01300 [Candidatus Aenigmarchaeota archaeon]|nr:hypothetical protein [Candidatus Aenigmarchaeota archaeon]